MTVRLVRILILLRISIILFGLLSFVALWKALDDKTTDSNTERATSQGFEKFQNRKQYSRLTEDILKSIPDEDLELAIFDYVALKIGDSNDTERESVTSLSKGFQMVFTTWVVEAEVNNGGFNQYFFNTDGVLAFEALEGFTLLGAKRYAEIMENAIAIYIKEKPELEKYKREGTLESFSESYKYTDLDALDDEFYSADSEENLSAMRIKYIREHPEEFTGD